MEFEKSYFYHSNISNYKNYMEKKYFDLAEDLTKHLQCKPQDRILDFGCATGLLVSEFIKRGFKNVKGTDISYWTIRYGKEELGLGDYLEYFNVNLLCEPKDYVFFLDVLEHVTTDEIGKLLMLTKINRPQKIIMRVPVASREGENFFLEVSRNDKTHIQCHDKHWWIEIFRQNGFMLNEELHLPSIYCSEGVYAAIFS